MSNTAVGVAPRIVPDAAPAPGAASGGGSASAVVALCINLQDATQRWARVQEEVRRGFPEAELVRVDAVHWRTLALEGLRLTPFTRWLVVNPERQAQQRFSHRQMDTPSSVACLLSHIRCWEWLRARPGVPYALILEDDVCFGRGFRAAWHDVAVPLLARGAGPEAPVQCLVLGYEAQSEARPHTVDGHRLVLADFFGTHAYAVTQAGAAVLLQHVWPLELQSDGYMLTLAQIGALRL